jgi:mannonate dehydratase
MKRNRRSFIKESTSLAALSVAGVKGIIPESIAQKESSIAASQPLKDAGMQLCEAYFFGMQPQKIALTKQMDVLSAVGGINPGMVGLKDVKPWEYEAISAVKKAWEKEGLLLKVIVGPPALGEKTKNG